MADLDVGKTYRSGELLGSPNLLYDEIVNFDVNKLPYSKGKDTTGYTLGSRKGYVIDQILSQLGGEVWYTTDIRRINKSDCKDEEYYYYFYQVSDGGNKYRILRKEERDQTSVTIINSGFRCQCNYDRFFDLTYAAGEAKEIDGVNTTSTGVASEEFGTRIYDDTVNLGSFSVGDYIMIYNATDNDSKFLEGQVRLIVDKGTVDSTFDTSGFNQYIELDLPFSGAPSDISLFPGVQYKVYPQFEATIGYVSNQGVHTIDINESIGNLGMTPSGSVCITSVQIYKNKINYLTDRGFNIFGGQGYDILTFSTFDTNVFSKDIISTFSYRNFLLAMGKDKISYAAAGEQDQFSFDISEELGIKSKYSFGLVDNNLLMATSDNRLQFIGLKGDGATIYIEKQPVDDFVKSHLDNMLDDDEVFIHEWNNNVYIFINTRSRPEAVKPNMTKILILDKDYQLRHVHEICNAVISGVKYGYFYGNGVYGYLGDRDYLFVNSNFQTFPVKSRISAYIGDQQNNGLVDAEGNSYRLIRRKSLHWLQLLLGAGIYTDGNTRIKIDTYRDGYKFEKLFDTVEGVERIDNWNKYFQGEEVVPSECFVDDLEDCDNINRECEGSLQNPDGEKILEPIIHLESENYPLEEVQGLTAKYPDYCICYDSRAYALSPFYNVYLYPRSKPADLFKITIVSDGYDRMSFMGMIGELTVEEINNARSGVNIIGEECNNTKKTCPVDNC